MTSAVSDKGKTKVQRAVPDAAVVEAPSPTSGSDKAKVKCIASGKDKATVTSAVSDKGKAKAQRAVSGAAVVEAPSATSGVHKAKVK